METCTLKISGMTCMGCSSSVKRLLSTVDGVSRAEVDLGAATAVVEFDPAKTNLDALKKAVAAGGFGAA